MNGDAEKRLRSVSRLPNVNPRNPGTLPIAPSDMLEPCTPPAWWTAIPADSRRSGGYGIAGASNRVDPDVYRAPVAQLDRAAASEAVGQKFESSRAHHFPKQISSRHRLLRCVCLGRRNARGERQWPGRWPYGRRRCPAGGRRGEGCWRRCGGTGHALGRG